MSGASTESVKVSPEYARSRSRSDWGDEIERSSWGRCHNSLSEHTTDVAIVDNDRKGEASTTRTLLMILVLARLVQNAAGRLQVFP